MLIASMLPHEAIAVANLHSKEIAAGFLSTLGTAFLSRLYAYMARSPFSTVLVAKDERDSIAGFLAGTTSTRLMYRWILLRYTLPLSIRLLPACCSLAVVKKILETIRYGLRDDKSNRTTKSTTATFASAATRAELLSIVVSPVFRRKNVGYDLVHEFEKYLVRQGILSYEVVTAYGNTASTAFYRGTGFSEKRRFVHHCNEMIGFEKTIDIV